MSADQDWSEAIKASIDSAENFEHYAASNNQQDAQAGYLPTSHSSENSSQKLSDCQQIQHPHVAINDRSCTKSQDQCITQSCTPASKMSRSSESAAKSSEKINHFVPESQQRYCPAVQQISPKMASQKQIESNCNINYHPSKVQPHVQDMPQRNQSQNQGATMTTSQTDNNVSNVVPSFSNRQPQNVTPDHPQAHPSTSHQSNQQKQSLNAPQNTQIRPVLSPRQTNIQQPRQFAPRQISSQQPSVGARQPHHVQHRMSHPHQRLPHPGSAGAFPSQKVSTPGYSPATRPQMIHNNNSQSPLASQSTRPSIQNQTQMPTASHQPQIHPSGTKRNELDINRIPQSQDHGQGFSNSPHQRMAPQMQPGEYNERMQQRMGMHPLEFEDEDMYYDEEDDEELDDMDDDEMEYPEFPNIMEYGYHSSDSDELSEEESALLEELRCCEDDIRYEEIVGRLQQKGVHPEEIDEMLYGNNYPQGMYPGENYDDNDEEEEAEGTVSSSSSQGQMPFMRNQLRQHAQAFQQGGQNQLRAYHAQPVGPSQKDISPSPVGMNGQQMAAGGFNQGMSMKTLPVSVEGTNQQGKTSEMQGLYSQPQQKTSDNCSLASAQANVLGEVKPQPELRLGQGNQEKRAPQGNAVESSQTSAQASGWQSPQNVARTPQIRAGDLRQPAPKAILQPGQPMGPQTPRPNQLNRPPNPQSQSGAVRLQASDQNNPSSIVVRPVQHLTVTTNNNQPGLPNQGTPNKPFIVRQTAPLQQLIISPASNNQQNAFVGTPHQNIAPNVKTPLPRLPSQAQQKPLEQQSVTDTIIQPFSQQQGNILRPATPVSQNVHNQQGMIYTPRLKTMLDTETAPSEASLARLKVMYMQQSLDQEIQAKKGAPGHPSGQQSVNTLNLNMHNRFLLPQGVNHLPIGHAGQSYHQQKQHNQIFPAYQPKHQLPPRQPIPAIVNPNCSSNPTIPGGRPVCSVVPFTSQNRSPNVANAQKQIAPQQSSFVRPRNPAPLSLQPSPGVVPNRMPIVTQTNSSPSIIPQASSSPSPSTGPAVTPTNLSPSNVPTVTPTNLSPSNVPTVTPTVSSTSTNPIVSRNLPQGNTLPLTSNQTVHQQAVTDIASQPQSQVPNINLDHLSEDKCIITGKGKQQGLTVNMIYKIRSPKDNSLIMALWNGERFEDLKESDLKALVHSVQVASPGGVQTSQRPMPDIQRAQSAQHGQSVMSSDKDKKEKSATLCNTSKFQSEFTQSLTQANFEEEPSYSSSEFHPHPGQNTTSDIEQTLDKSLKTCADIPPIQTTYLKPLPQGQQKNEPLEEEEDDSFLFKKPFNENEDYFRVCQYCGYTSKNFKRCEGCRRVFQGEVKIHSLKKQPTKPSAIIPTSGVSNLKPMATITNDEPMNSDDPAGEEMETNVPFNGRGRGRGARGRSGRTRGGGMRGRMGMKGSAGYLPDFDGSDSDNSSLGPRKNSDGSGSSSDGSGKKRQTRPKSKNPAPRKRKRNDEPVTVTISSDEDEPSSTSNNIAIHAPSPAHSAGSESPIFPSLPSEPINAFGRFRRVLMEDEEGQSKLSKKIHQQVMTPQMNRFEEEEEEDEDDDDDSNEPPTYEIDIRSVRIGSMRTQPEGPLLINMQGVCFKVRSERTEEAFEFEILAQDVEQVKFFSGQTQPVLFLFLTPECGEVLRSNCHMEPGDDEYFDPSSTDMKQKMVVIIIEGFNYMPYEMLRETLSLWADVNHVEDECFIEELTEESANDLLIQSAPAVLTADVERDVVKFKRRYIRDSNMLQPPRIPGSPSDSTDNEPDSTSSSPPEIKHFFGSSIRLLQYPPPPARGIPITTEDLFCLTEGEFLNDVIIDFYLQYLYQERLTEENKRRTHIFSSFFYKRLTQRDRHSDKTEEDAKKSLPERRHARVKKWTKTVDLFSKDFIIVPINEHSHWYLAVICFPGLANPEVVPFIPSASHKGDVDDEPNDNGEEKPCEENGSQDSLPKTILGQQLNAKQCLDNEDSKYNIGQKQPCILMFDSLAGPSRNPNVRMLREYLQCEWNAKKSEPRNIAKILRGSTPKVPQQSNYSDCGVYLLHYVESFFEDPIADFQIPMKGLQNWFPEELVHNKRRDIHELIMCLHRRYQEERGDPRILDIKFESTPREPPMKFPQNSELNSRPEEGMFPGFSRDDESSNSSISGETYRAEMASGAMMEHNSSFRNNAQLGNQHMIDRQKDEEEEDGNEDTNETNENFSEKQSHSKSST